MNYILHFSPLKFLEKAFFLKNSGRGESGRSWGKVDGPKYLNVNGFGKSMAGIRNENRRS